MSKANYQTAADAFGDWRDDVLSGQPPTLYRVSTGELNHIEIGPKLVTLIGGAPGAGKTAFTMQCMVDALRLNESLRCVVCNVEMPPSVLLDRQLARLSGVELNTIRYRKLDGKHADRIDQAMHTLEAVADRLCFVRPPFVLDNVAATADAFGAHVIVLDYIQRIRAPGEHGDRRGSVDATMDYIRQFADAGVAMVVVAAVSRQKDSKGRSTYDGDTLSLASFRESSELEFGADDAFILAPTGKSGKAVLKHLKARHTEAKDLTLRFVAKYQRFEVVADDEPTRDGPALADLAELWGSVDAASDEGESDD
ncbi:MAG: replicative DNA helicase [Pirellulaceae bacterium]|nr:MAG: replicative DNA helicase [Pirellulaceae bacterium]